MAANSGIAKTSEVFGGLILRSHAVPDARVRAIAGTVRHGEEEHHSLDRTAEMPRRSASRMTSTGAAWRVKQWYWAAA